MAHSLDEEAQMRPKLLRKTNETTRRFVSIYNILLISETMQTSKRVPGLDQCRSYQHWGLQNDSYRIYLIIDPDGLNAVAEESSRHGEGLVEATGKSKLINRRVGCLHWITGLMLI